MKRKTDRSNKIVGKNKKEEKNNKEKKRENISIKISDFFFKQVKSSLL